MRTTATHRDERITPDIRRAWAELSASIDSPENSRALAEVITEYINPVYLTLDLASTFMGTRQMNFGDILVKKFKGRYHVQQIAPGQITLGEQVLVRDKALSYNLDILSAKALYNVLELRHGGPAFTPEQVRQDVQDALREKVLMRGWNALANIWTTGNASSLTVPGATYSNFIDAGGPLTSTALDHAIDHVNYWSGRVKAIVGTETALAPLTEFGQYRLISGSNSDNYVTINGQPAGTYNNVSPYGPGPKGVESYRGVSNIVRIPQTFDRSEFPATPLLPNDFVLVIGEDIGEFITYGGPETKEYMDNEPTPPYWTYETYIQFGMMIWNAKGLVKIKVSGNTIP